MSSLGLDPLSTFTKSFAVCFHSNLYFYVLLLILIHLMTNLPFLYLANKIFLFIIVWWRKFFLYNYKFFFIKSKNFFITIMGIHAVIIYFVLCLSICIMVFIRIICIMIFIYIVFFKIIINMKRVFWDLQVFFL